MTDLDDLVQDVGDKYDEVVKDLSVEDAITVAEGVSAYIDGALAGLREDLEQRD